jgi:hypothetical protein
MKLLGFIFAVVGVTAFIIAASGPNWWGLTGALLAGVGCAMMVLPRDGAG